MNAGARLSFAVVCALASVPTNFPAQAQEWPVKPVRIVQTSAPGGATDYLARIIADSLTTVFKQQFIVETRSGAAGAIGINSVVASPPDGYNFVVTTLSMMIFAPVSNPKVGYLPERDLTNIAYLGGSPTMVAVNAKSSIRSIQEFIAFGKKRPSPLTYSSSGVGSSGHLFGESFGQKVGIKVEHVPYKGAGQGLIDLVGGHIDWAAQTVTSTAGQVRAGTLRGLAITAKERMADYPEMPTLAELGHPEFTSPVWFMLVGPKGLPPAIVDRMNTEISRIMTSPAITDRLRKDGMIVEAMSVPQLSRFLENERRIWAPAIEKAGLMPN